MRNDMFNTPRELKGKEDTLALVAELFDLAEQNDYRVREVVVDEKVSTLPACEIKILMVAKGKYET